MKAPDIDWGGGVGVIQVFDMDAGILLLCSMPPDPDC